MAHYTYEATRANGETVTNKAKAQNEQTLRADLVKRGLTLVSATLITSPLDDLNVVDRWLLRFSGVKLVEKVFFMQHLEVMLRTGFSIGRALSTLERQTTNKKLQSVIHDLQQKVESGISFSKALRDHTDVFPELIINMIEAGELSGKLDHVLKQIAIQMRKEYTLKSKVRGAMVYPVIVLIAMVGIATAMMIFVVPQLTSIYEEVDAELPLATRVLISTSHFLTRNGILVAIIAVVGAIGFMRLIKTTFGRKYWHKFLLFLPVVGSIVHKINLAQFARTFTSLLQTDIPIVKSFKIISETLGNQVYRTFLSAASEDLKKGKTITSILEKDPKLFPPIATQMVAIGEESGSLDTTVEEVAKFYEEDVDQTMNNLSTIIEPILLLVLGVGIGGMAVAIIMPMYSLVNAI